MLEVSSKLNTMLEKMDALQATVDSLAKETRSTSVVWNLYYRCGYAAAVRVLMLLYNAMPKKIPKVFALFKEKNAQLDLVNFLGDANWQALRLTIDLETAYKRDFCQAMKAALSSLKDHKHALFVATALTNTTIPRKSYDHQETQLVGAVKAKNLQELLQKEVEEFEERPQKEPQDQSFEQL